MTVTLRKPAAVPPATVPPATRVLPRSAAAHAVCTPECVGPDPGGRRSAVGRALVGVRTAITTVLCVGAIRVLGAGRSRGSVRRSAWALHLFSRPVLAALGVRVQTVGEPRSGPALVVGNHCSFLDILVLSAAAPMRQVAKVEVGGWPLVGGLARRAGSIFTDRARWRQLPQVVDEASAALRQGHKVQGFPEATTRCGTAIDTFHRSLFQAAIDAAVVVAPVTLRYLDADGAPTATPAFLGEETLAAALRRVLGARGLVVRVAWLPAIPAIAGTGTAAVDRARLAELVQRAVARDLQVSVLPRGRRVPATVTLPTPRSGSVDADPRPADRAPLPAA